MSDSGDTDVLLLIPNDFFAVDEAESQELDDKCRRDDLINFSIKMSDSGVQTVPDRQIPCHGIANNDQNWNKMNTSKAVMPTESNLLLQEIDSYLQQQPSGGPVAPKPLYCESISSEIPSLRDLWQSEGSTQAHKSILEERLRRRHLEKNLEATQLELIEAQQKVSVALSVDQAKDNIINKLRDSIKAIQQQANSRNDELQQKIRELECELVTSLESSKRLKETNEVLEGQVARLTTATNDMREISTKQLKDLQIRLSNSLKAEQLINDDLVRTRNQLVIEKNCHRDSQEAWGRKEANYKGEQETLRASLKHYYQKQLNDVVGEKLNEFQKQMDDLEDKFKDEYMQRERIIAERAMQQMELLIRKNEEEVRLLTEKHEEEIKFVELQLEMTRTTITEAQQRIMSSRQGQNDQRRVKINYDSEAGSPKKKMNNVTNKTPGKRFNNYNFTTFRPHSPELQGYIDTLLKKSPKFNSTRMNTPHTKR